MLGLARFVHLVAVATWLGGVIALGPLVVALRRAGATPELLRAAARAFAAVAWTAMAVAIPTGLLQVALIPLPWSYGRLHAKLGAVALLVAVTAVHQRLAGRVGPAPRRALEVAVLAASLAAFAAAVRLRHA